MFFSFIARTKKRQKRCIYSFLFAQNISIFSFYRNWHRRLKRYFKLKFILFLHQIPLCIQMYRVEHNEKDRHVRLSSISKRKLLKKSLSSIIYINFFDDGTTSNRWNTLTCIMNDVTITSQSSFFSSYNIHVYSNKRPDGCCIDFSLFYFNQHHILFSNSYIFKLYMFQKKKVINQDVTIEISFHLDASIVLSLTLNISLKFFSIYLNMHL